MAHQTASLAAAIIGAIATSSPLEQAPKGTFAEEALSLSVAAEVRSVSYTASDADAVVFVRDHIPIVVSIGNVTRGSLAIESSSRLWWEQLAFTVYEVGETKELLRVGRRPVIGRASAIVEARPPLTLAASARASERFTLKVDNGEPLPPGRYRVSVSIDPEHLPPAVRRFRNILNRELLIEVKDAQTNDELVDQFLQLAYRAHASRLVLEARAWAEKALALNRDSITALNDLGSSFLAEGNCQRAAPLLQRAILLLRSGGDPLINLSETSREHLAVELGGRLSARCSGRP